jgi:hypothetical protein
MNKQQFKAVYDHCQTLQPVVHRNSVIRKIEEVTGKKIRSGRIPLDTKVARGFFIALANTEHPFYKRFGGDIVVLAKPLNKCWERFVNVKEAMHLMDEDAEKTDSFEKFEELLNDWCTLPDMGIHAPGISDMVAMVMALACLCPEATRLEFKAELDAKHTDHFGIAVRLKIPEYHVPLLFSPHYLTLVKYLTD